MFEQVFKAYVFPEDNDVVFVGLYEHLTRKETPHTPLLGTYLCDEKEINKKFDRLEADLRRCRRDALRKMQKVQKSLKEKQSALAYRQSR